MATRLSNRLLAIFDRVWHDLRPTGPNGNLARALPHLVGRLARKAIRRGERSLSGMFPLRRKLPKNWRTNLNSVGNVGTVHYLRRRQTPSWLFAPDDAATIVGGMKEHSPDAITSTVEYANSLLHGSFELFGRWYDLGDPPAWDTDPRCGRQWPDAPSLRVPIIFHNDHSDIKFPWELARFNHAVFLGLAWQYTSNDQFALCARKWILDFIHRNPYGRGLHWTCPMEAAIRSINWITTLQLILDAECCDDEFADKLVESLLQHGRYIAAHLEHSTRGSNTNHYTADLLGLYAIGTYLPEWPESESWRELARKELLEEARTQIGSDGFHYENSFGYHRLTAEMFWLAWWLGRCNGDNVLEPLAEMLRRMLVPIASAVDDDGRLPSFGDCDDGWVLRLDPGQPQDIRPTIDVLTKTLYCDSSQPNTAAAFWLCCNRSNDQQKNLPHFETKCSRFFKESGIAILRSSNLRIMSYANSVGCGGMGGHKHNDLLSLTIDVNGEPFVIDPGTGAYTENFARRNAMRSTSAHAVVMVDGAEQNRFVGDQLFFLWNDARPTVEAFEDSDSNTLFAASHDGYCRLPGHVRHTRRVDLDKRDECVTVVDTLSGDGVHEISQLWPIGNVGVRYESDGRITLTGLRGDHALSIAIDGAARALLRPMLTYMHCSRGYSQWDSCRRLEFCGRVSLPLTIVTTIQLLHCPTVTPATSLCTSQRTARVSSGDSVITEVELARS